MFGMNAREFAFAQQAQALGMVRVRRILRLVALVNETPEQRIQRIMPANNRGRKPGQVDPLSVRQRVFQSARLVMELGKGKPIAVSKIKVEVHKRTGIPLDKVEKNLCQYPRTEVIKSGGYWSLA